MKSIFEAAHREYAPNVEGLQAVVISAMPDGLIVWSWALDSRSNIALHFAALDRAASTCLYNLGTSAAAMSLSLRTEDLQIVSWPMGEFEASDAAVGHRSGLVANFVFDGDVLPGMAMAHGKRALAQLERALDEAGVLRHDEVRAALVAELLAVEDPCALVGRLARRTGLSFEALTRPEGLDEDNRFVLIAELEAAEAERAVELASQELQGEG